MEEALALVILALAGAVPFRRARMRGAVLPPIAGMIGAPLARALATHLLVLGVGNELLLAAIGAAALLAGGAGARGLLGMASGGFKLLVAITATPLTHPYRVKASARIYRCPKSRPPFLETVVESVPRPRQLGAIPQIPSEGVPPPAPPCRRLHRRRNCCRLISARTEVGESTAHISSHPAFRCVLVYVRRNSLIFSVLW